LGNPALALMEDEDFLGELDYPTRYVPGLRDVKAGARFPFPVTVYNISGDDTSGIAGLLMPDGEFKPTQAPLTRQRYYNFDSVPDYPRNPDYDGVNGRPVMGDAWVEAEVVWDGSAAGSITQEAVEVEKGDKLKVVVNRRLWDASIPGMGMNAVPVDENLMRTVTAKVNRSEKEDKRGS
jgi:hypothetical protein